MRLPVSSLGLAVACGSLLSLPLSGPLIARVGTDRMVATTAALAGVGLTTVAVGYRVGVGPVVVDVAVGVLLVLVTVPVTAACCSSNAGPTEPD